MTKKRAKPQAPPRKRIIMVSSAVYGIEELLEAVFGILNTAGFTVWMSHKGTVPVDPARSNFENCLAAVDGCDMFLGILTTSYGSGRDGDGLSITHQEILRALELKKPRWFLAHRDLVFARGLLRDLGYKTAAERGKLTLSGKKLVEDLRVIDMYEAVIQAEKKLADRQGNWAQPFATQDDGMVFVVGQFLRYAEAEEFVRMQPLSAGMESRRNGGYAHIPQPGELSREAQPAPTQIAGRIAARRIRHAPSLLWANGGQRTAGAAGSDGTDGRRVAGTAGRGAGDPFLPHRQSLEPGQSRPNSDKTELTAEGWQFGLNSLTFKFLHFSGERGTWAGAATTRPNAAKERRVCSGRGLRSRNPPGVFDEFARAPQQAFPAAVAG